MGLLLLFLLFFAQLQVVVIINMKLLDCFFVDFFVELAFSVATVVYMAFLYPTRLNCLSCLSTESLGFTRAPSDGSAV